MNTSNKTPVVKRLLLTLWAMATLVLIFVLGLLINEMIQSGGNPLSAISPEQDELPTTRVEPQDWRLGLQGTREIALYFVSEDGHWLAPEGRTIEYRGRTVENCREALHGLITGPENAPLTPLLPGQTQLRALYLREDGELVIDLSSEALIAQQGPKSAEMEALFAYGIVNTMTQEALRGEDEMTVQTVRFLFDGAPPQDKFPAHLDLGAPLAQDRRWTRAGSE